MLMNRTIPPNEFYLSPSGTIRTRLKEQFRSGSLDASEKVSVNLVDNTPVLMSWRNRDYKITKIGLHHDYYEGKIIVHIFSCLSNDLFLKLKFDTKHLTWNLMEIDQI